MLQFMVSSNLVFTVSSALLLISCASQPYFVIDNQLNKKIRVEFVFDSLDVREMIANDIILKHESNNTRSIRYDDPQRDSVKNAIASLDSTSLLKYLLDSLSLISLKLDEFYIESHKSNHPSSGSDEYYTDFRFKAFEYYGNDTALIKKILDLNTISFFVPGSFSLFKPCRSCGDCSCYVEGAFPNAKEVKVVISEDDYIILNRKNFKRILSKKRFRGQAESYVLSVFPIELRDWYH